MALIFTTRLGVLMSKTHHVACRGNIVELFELEQLPAQVFIPSLIHRRSLTVLSHSQPLPLCDVHGYDYDTVPLAYLTSSLEWSDHPS